MNQPGPGFESIKRSKLAGTADEIYILKNSQD